MHQPDPYQDPPAYRWRQCGLAASRDVVTDAVAPEAWEYVVTVRPVVEDDASKPWTLSADLTRWTSCCATKRRAVRGHDVDARPA